MGTTLAGATALVTGASGGIGEQLARQLADRGTNLVLVARSEDKLAALREELQAAHRDLTVTVLVADLADSGSSAELAAQVEAAGITVDVLINNAGVGSHEPFVDEDATAIARQIQLNVGSLVDLTARFLPAMVARGSGAVINVSSTAGFQPTPSMAVYGATKAFVLSFTEALWGETRSTGVRVFTLCPGATETNFFDNTGKQFLTGGRQSAEQVAAIAIKALDGHGPTVISGLKNKVGTIGARIMPRAAMVLMSGQIVKER